MDTQRIYTEYDHKHFNPLYINCVNDKGLNKDFSTYWKAFGFTTLQTLKTPKHKYKDISEITNDILTTNSGFFNNDTILTYPIVSIDGTCCTGKTTLCSKFKCIKTNKHFNSIGMNTNPMSALGYYFTSLEYLDDFYILSGLTLYIVYINKLRFSNIFSF